MFPLALGKVFLPMAVQRSIGSRCILLVFGLRVAMFWWLVKKGMFGVLFVGGVVSHNHPRHLHMRLYSKCRGNVDCRDGC